MKRILAITVFATSLLLVQPAADARTMKKSSNGVKLVCENTGRGKSGGCTLRNSTRKTMRCTYGIYYSWNPGSGKKYERKRGSATLRAKQTRWVLRTRGFRCRWSSLILSCR